MTLAPTYDAVTLWALDFEPEMECESSHKHPSNRVCAGNAVALMDSCVPTFLGCANQVVFYQRAIAENVPCRECGELPSTHWRVRAIGGIA